VAAILWCSIYHCPPFTGYPGGNNDRYRQTRVIQKSNFICKCYHGL